MSRFDVVAPAVPVPSIPDPSPVVPLVWPADASRRLALARTGVPRLLFVAPGDTPPEPVDLYEDWVRLPASADEVALRAANLERRLFERDGPAA